MESIPHKSLSTSIHSPGSGSLVRVGGGLGVAASIVGLAIFLGACAGFDASLKLSFLPVLLALPGLVLTIVGAITQQNPADTHVLGAMFPCVVGIIGGAVEMAAWLRWPVFQ